MFGVKAGTERFQSPLNQYVVSRFWVRGNQQRDVLSYWVLHTRGEDPTSVLISEMRNKGISNDEIVDNISGLTFEILSASQWEKESGRSIIKWGSPEKTNLHSSVVEVAPKRSCVLGYEV